MKAVVPPRPPPGNRGALWVLFWTVGLLMGLFARDVVDGPAPLRPAGAQPATAAGLTSGDARAAPALDYAATIAADVHDALFPSPTATATPAPTATPALTPAAAFCRDPAPGTVCRVPFPPPPTPTPFPDCAEMARLAPGDWCVWLRAPAAEPDVQGNEETR
jgi:hypothetical protein